MEKRKCVWKRKDVIYYKNLLSYLNDLEKQPNIEIVNVIQLQREFTNTMDTFILYKEYIDDVKDNKPKEF